MSELLSRQSPPFDSEGLLAEPSEIDDYTKRLLNTHAYEFPGYCHRATHYDGLLAYLADKMPHINSLVSPDLLPSREARDDLARAAITDFLNNRFAPICDTRQDRTFTNSITDRKRRVGVCIDAERRFVNIFDSMQLSTREDTTDYSMYEGWTIVVDDDGEPFAIRKHNDEISTLSLVPLVVDGCRFPAGSFFDMRLSEGPKKSELSSGQHRLKLVTPYQNISSILFLRISGFAHEPEERAELYKNLSTIRKNARMDLAEITELAQKCIPISTRVGFEN